MEAVRMTLNSARFAPIIDLPRTLRDREVDIIVLPSQVVSVPEKRDGITSMTNTPNSNGKFQQDQTKNTTNGTIIHPNF